MVFLLRLRQPVFYRRHSRTQAARLHWGQSLQRAITSMVSEPIKTNNGQISGNASSAPTANVRIRGVLCTCAKRQPATLIWIISVWPPAAGVVLEREVTSIMANSRVPWTKVKGPGATRRTASHCLRKPASVPVSESARWARSEVAAPYSITSSARASSVGGISRPSILAVLRLMISSNFVGCTTGRSAAFSPWRIRPT